MDYDMIWDEDYIEEIEAINDILNIKQEVKNMKKVIYNIKNEKGNTVANQFLIIEGTDYTFISYKTPIAILKAASAIIFINESAFNYSRTTTRHFLNYFENVLTATKPTRKEVESWMQNGFIPASANCYNTDINIRIVNEEDF